MARSNPEILAITIEIMRTLRLLLDIGLLAPAVIAHTQGKGNVFTYIAVSNYIKSASPPQ